jgi:hypothetical protein
MRPAAAGAFVTDPSEKLAQAASHGLDEAQETKKLSS